MTPQEEQALREQCRKEAEERHPILEDFTVTAITIVKIQRQVWADALYSERSKNIENIMDARDDVLHNAEGHTNEQVNWCLGILDSLLPDPPQTEQP